MVDQAQGLREMMQKKKEDAESRQTVFLAIASGKGGVGKSVFAVNFGIALAQRGKRVLIVDADFGLANVDIMLGVNARYNLSHVIKNEADIRDVVEKGRGGVLFISGGSGVEELTGLSKVDAGRLMERLSSLADMADIVLFDMGAGVHERLLQVVRACGEAVVIMTPEPTSILDAYALTKAICRMENRPRIRLVANRVDSCSEGAKTLNNFISVSRKYIGESTPMTSLGHVRNDPAVPRAVRAQSPIMLDHPSAPAASDIARIADAYLCGETVAPDVGGIKGFLARLLSRGGTGTMGTASGGPF